MSWRGLEIVNPFNHPPFIIHYLRFLDFISTFFNLNFRFVFRSVTSMVDVGSAFLVYRLLIRQGLYSPWPFLLYLLAPATIIISGYHGNTDTVMMFFVLLTALLIEKPAWSGLAFGMALNIKAVPIMFVVLFLAYLHGWKSRFWFLMVAAFTIAILSFPFTLQDPVLIIHEVLGYAGTSGRWGWTRVLFIFTGDSYGLRLIGRIGAYALLAYVFYLSVRMNRGRRSPLMLQLGAVLFLFMSFTSGWGANYMAWLDPFPIALGVLPAIIYYSVSGALLGYLYFIVHDEGSPLMGLCWLAVLIVTWIYMRTVRKQIEARQTIDSAFEPTAANQDEIH